MMLQLPGGVALLLRKRMAAHRPDIVWAWIYAFHEKSYVQTWTEPRDGFDIPARLDVTGFRIEGAPTYDLPAPAVTYEFDYDYDKRLWSCASCAEGPSGQYLCERLDGTPQAMIGGPEIMIYSRKDGLSSAYHSEVFGDD